MDITEQQNELIEANGGKASPELAAQLLEQALNGDTANAENGSQPATTQVTEENTPKIEGQDGTHEEHSSARADTQQAQQQQQVDESQLNAENAVILAKDGKHTIPYDKLVEARNGEKEWKQSLMKLNNSWHNFKLMHRNVKITDRLQLHRTTKQISHNQRLIRV